MRYSYVRHAGSMQVFSISGRVDAKLQVGLTHGP